MPQFIDLTGKTFFRLTVISRGKRKGKRQRFAWNCACTCGNTLAVTSTSLNSGHTKSCGCWSVDKNHTHGQSYHVLYPIWLGMKKRCENPHDNCYHNYGGRGVSVCARWGNIENFISDMGIRPSKHHSIDRIDNDGNYTPENCKWSTPKEQSNNTRHNRILTLHGVEKTLMQWSRHLEINYGTILSRLHMGWSDERALTQPVRKR